MPHARKECQLGDPDIPVLDDHARIKELLGKITWPSHEPIQFLRRRGTASVKDEADYIAMHKPENFTYMFELGIRLPKRFHFYKGMGLAHERPEIEKTIEAAKQLHKLGMKISVYVGGTLFSDSMFQEVPEAASWQRIDQAGDPVTYSGFQLWRYFPCLNNPDFVAFNKQALDIAQDEVEADEIFFDNQILRHEPRSCRCEHCVNHLREYVRKNYTLDEVEQRYGYREYPALEPPIWSQANPAWAVNGINDPGQQDWVNHRVATVFEFYKAMKDHVNARRSGVSVGMNIKGVHAHNRAFDHGIDHNAFARELDFTCLDSGQAHSRMIGEALVSEIRAYKMSQSLRIPIEGGGAELDSCIDQVYTFRKVLPGYGRMGGADRILNFSPAMQFIRRNQRMFIDREHIADAAVLRSSPSVNYNCMNVHDSLYPFEQTLLIKKVPFTLIYDANRDELDRCKVICLVEQESLSDAWLETLAAFCKKGGGLVVTGNTASYTHWRRPRRPVHGLEQFFDFKPGKELVKKEFGKGRFVYIPALEKPFVLKPEGDWAHMGLEHILPLKNSEDIVDLVRWAAGGTFTAEITGCDRVVAELIEADKGGMTIHLMNFDPACAGSELTVAIPDAAGRGGVYRGPDREDVKIKDCGSFKVKAPEVYGVIEVSGT